MVYLRQEEVEALMEITEKEGNLPNLTKIEETDLVFSGDIEDDRTNTCLTLNDYDWMMYNLSTRFRTEALGTLHVLFEYSGFTASQMFVLQEKDGEVKRHIFDFSSELFKEHIKKFMEAHIASWDSTFAFNGEDEALAFYNAVIENGKTGECNFPERNRFMW